MGLLAVRRRTVMRIRKIIHILLIVILFAVSVGGISAAETGRSGQVVFSSEDEALQALKAALKSEDSERMVELFGRPSRNIFITGDSAGDAAALRRLWQRFSERAELLSVVSENFQAEQWYLIRFGKDGWNMHIPLVNRGNGWSFASEYATAANLRIRREFNELAAVDTLRALAKAQEEYKSRDRNGDGVLEYARRFVSSPGKKDGLYWPSDDGAFPSPLDGIVARAINDGYKPEGKDVASAKGEAKDLLVHER